MKYESPDQQVWVLAHHMCNVMCEKKAADRCKLGGILLLLAVEGCKHTSTLLFAAICLLNNVIACLAR